MTHLQSLRDAVQLADERMANETIDLDLSREAGMDGNLARLLQAARDLDRASPYQPSWRQIHSLITRGKVEILADIEAGRVPATVASFGELHDYVDANCYAGLCDEEGWPSEVDWMDGDLGNYIQDELNSWLRTGRD
jgi:hypothetical protein